MEKDITDSWNKNTLEVKDIIPIVTMLAKEERIDLTIPMSPEELSKRPPEEFPEFRPGRREISPDVVKKTHEEGLEHVAKLIHRVYRWSQEIHPDPMGSFLTAVVENDLEGAVGKADSTNVRALPVYLKYFYNYAPMRWRTQKTNR